jgi:hypothetical protein
MPIILAVKCSRCNARGAQFPDQYAAFLQDDGAEVLLSHPGEQIQLQRLGWTWDRAQSERRIRIYSAYGCAACGTVCHRTEDDHTRGCEKCGGTNLSRLRSDEMLLCPSCKERTVRVRITGIS